MIVSLTDGTVYYVYSTGNTTRDVGCIKIELLRNQTEERTGN